MDPRLFVLSGPSGVGKSSLVKNLLASNSNLRLAVSATTRAKRKGEREGLDYYFIDDVTFDNLLRKDAFVEWALVHGNRNGTLKSEVEDAFSSNTSLILDIDTQGARLVKDLYGDQALLLFIAPPSMSELERRLRERGTENEQTIQLRLRNAEHELALAHEYDEIVINDSFDETLQKLKVLFASKMR